MLRIKKDINLNILREYGFYEVKSKRPKIKSSFAKWLFVYYGSKVRISTTYKIVVRKDRTLSFNSPTNEIIELIHRMSVNGILEEI